MSGQIVRAVCIAFIGSSLIAGSVAAQSPAGDARPTEATLYERIGGYDVIAAAIDDFLGRFGEDPELAPFLGGLNAAAGERIRQYFVDFVCSRTGGPCLYLGRGMKGAHEGLPITGEHFDRVTGHLLGAFADSGAGVREQRELASLFGGLRADIVNP